MKNLIWTVMVLLSVFSCGEALQKPDHILDEDKMAELIADFAINEQTFAIGGNINSENATRYILKKYNIKAELFTESYQYYMTKPDTMQDIFDQAEDIIKAKDPGAEAYINKKLKESGNLPPQVRQ